MIIIIKIKVEYPQIASKWGVDGGFLREKNMLNFTRNKILVFRPKKRRSGEGSGRWSKGSRGPLGDGGGVVQGPRGYGRAPWPSHPLLCPSHNIWKTRKKKIAAHLRLLWGTTPDTQWSHMDGRRKWAPGQSAPEYAGLCRLDGNDAGVRRCGPSRRPHSCTDLWTLNCRNLSQNIDAATLFFWCQTRGKYY